MVTFRVQNLQRNQDQFDVFNQWDKELPVICGPGVSYYEDHKYKKTPGIT